MHANICLVENEYDASNFADEFFHLLYLGVINKCTMVCLVKKSFIFKNSQELRHSLKEKKQAITP
jgi:hypothetical protein